MHTIYRIINNVTRKFYIGRTCDKIQYRFKNHIRSASSNYKYSHNGRLQRSIRKYGAGNFDIKEIDKCSTLEDAVRLELFYIKYYNSENPKYGYNMVHDNGNGRPTQPKENLEKFGRKIHNIKPKVSVPFSKERNKWVASCRINGKLIAKRFSKEADAKKALDVLNIIRYGSEGNLYNPRESYSEEYIRTSYEKLSFSRKRKSKFFGVFSQNHKDKTYFGARCNKDKTYCGMFDSEESAAKAYDICQYYISGKLDKINFPEILTLMTLQDIKSQYESILNRVKNNNNYAKKTSGYHHVQRHNKKWRFFLTHNGSKFQSKVFPTELEATQAYNEYATLLLGEKAELNEIISPASSVPV